MRPMSASIHLFQQKMLNMEENQNDVFNYDEVEKMCKAKCNDIGIELRENMIYKFNEYCKNKCKNRQVDFTEMYLGYYSIKILAKIIKTSDRISYLNLTRNNIGDKGLELLANALSNSVSCSTFSRASTLWGLSTTGFSQMTSQPRRRP